ncbi:methyltransferase family protein [Hoeflea marina]|uniref:Methyltransferase family protein n=1 Tax=Hoeflea marina TaxID=274592 RepID=A0A317PK12_9HYPH|nr:class I SAM-dependent methyltransferase [Hoeflea marina]PWW00226.1 methyltransferase family protein [Hoeflea marina]
MAMEKKELWSTEHAEKYESENYGSGMAGYVMRRSHSLIEDEFSSDRHFSDVLEVGAGSGIHLSFVRHSFDSYTMTDGYEPMLAQLEAVRDRSGNPNVRVELKDAARLDYPDNTFDRLIATHVLEHMPSAHMVLEEWKRVVKPGGVISVVVPCDPGMAWRLGRYFGPRAAAKRRGIDYDYIQALEHVNSITNLNAITDHHFADQRKYWWPLRFEQTDLNLILGINAIVA